VRDLLEPRPVDLVDLFAAVTALIAPEAESVHVSIAVDVPPGTPAVLGEAERLRQVLLNLTRNAIDVLPEGGLQAKLKLGRPLRVKLGIDVTAEHVTIEMLPQSLTQRWISADGLNRVEVAPSGDGNDNSQ